MDNTTLDGHKAYTFKEITESTYYTNVIVYLREKNIKSICDVGGCTGEFTKILLNDIPSIKHATVIEPLKKNFEYIKSNLPKANVINNALFYGKDYVNMALLPNVGGATVLSDDYPLVETSKTITLEDISDKFDFIKIDIEGAERNVIENSTTLKDIPFIEIEFHHYDSELAEEKNRIPFLNKFLPRHTPILIGSHYDRDASIFLAII